MISWLKLYTFICCFRGPIPPMVWQFFSASFSSLGSKNYPSLDPAYNNISFFFVFSNETQIY